VTVPAVFCLCRHWHTERCTSLLQSVEAGSLQQQ